MNIVLTNVNQYIQMHEAFRLDTLNALAYKYGFKVWAKCLDDFDYPEYSNVVICPNTDWEEQKKHLNDFVKQEKPKKIVNFLEYLVPAHWVEYDCEMIYFVRGCVEQTLRSMLPKLDKEKSDHLEIINRFTEWSQKENKMINDAHRVITDSPNSQTVIKNIYNIDADVCLEYVNPEKYLNMPTSNAVVKSVYNVGRLDFQKGMHLISKPQDWEVHVIGKNELNDNPYYIGDIVKHPAQAFETYKDIIKDFNFGLFPSIWESNGYTVQECLAMGKIPVVQKGSGGNERLLKSGINSVIIDFVCDNWEMKLEHLVSENHVLRMQEAAKATLTQDMYQESLEKFIEVIC